MLKKIINIYILTLTAKPKTVSSESKDASRYSKTIGGFSAEDLLKSRDILNFGNSVSRGKERKERDN